MHSFKSEGNISSPIMPLIIVVLPAFDGPKIGIKITSYIFKNSIVLYISLIIFEISSEINLEFFILFAINCRFLIIFKFNFVFSLNSSLLSSSLGISFFTVK